MNANFLLVCTLRIWKFF